MWNFISRWLGVAVSILFVGLLIHSVNLTQVGSFLREAQYVWLFPAVAASLVSFIFRAERFREFLAPLKAFTLEKAYRYISINYMGNNIYPARAGEFLLSYVVKREEGIAISSSLAVTLLGRVIDALILLLFLLVPLLSGTLPQSLVIIIWLGMALFGGMFAFLSWLVFGRRSHLGWAEAQLHRLPPDRMSGLVHRSMTIAREFRRGLLPLRTPSVALKAFGLGFLIWIFEATVFWSIGHAFAISLNLATLTFLVAITNIVSSVPSGPAGIGTFDAVVTLGLTIHGINRDHAAAYALLLHLTQVIPITIIGLISYGILSVKSRPLTMEPLSTT